MKNILTIILLLFSTILCAQFAAEFQNFGPNGANAITTGDHNIRGLFDSEELLYIASDVLEDGSHYYIDSDGMLFQIVRIVATSPLELEVDNVTIGEVQAPATGGGQLTSRNILTNQYYISSGISKSLDAKIQRLNVLIEEGGGLSTQEVNTIVSDTATSVRNYIDANPPADGESAYDIAVTNGFVGTEQDWLTSLEGVNGTGITLIGNVPTVGDLPSSGNTQGDLYIVLADGEGYAWDGTMWNNVGPIQGPQGVQGPAGDPATDDQTITFDNPTRTLTITGGNSQVIPDEVDDADANATNELQTVSKVGSTVTLSNGGGSFTDDNTQLNEAQVDGFVSNNGYLTTEVDGSVSNELQTISKVGATVTLSNGGGSFTDTVDDADADPNNEIQTISKVDSTVTLSNSGGSFVDAVNDADADPTNEIQTISLDGDTVKLSRGGGNFNLPTPEFVEQNADTSSTGNVIRFYNQDKPASPVPGAVTNNIANSPGLHFQNNQLGTFNSWIYQNIGNLILESPRTIMQGAGGLTDTRIEVSQANGVIASWGNFDKTWRLNSEGLVYADDILDPKGMRYAGDYSPLLFSVGSDRVIPDLGMVRRLINDSLGTIPPPMEFVETNADTSSSGDFIRFTNDDNFADPASPSGGGLSTGLHFHHERFGILGESYFYGQFGNLVAETKNFTVHGIGEPAGTKFQVAPSNIVLDYQSPANGNRRELLLNDNGLVYDEDTTGVAAKGISYLEDFYGPRLLAAPNENILTSKGMVRSILIDSLQPIRDSMTVYNQVVRDDIYMDFQYSLRRNAESLVGLRIGSNGVRIFGDTTGFLEIHPTSLNFPILAEDPPFDVKRGHLYTKELLDGGLWKERMYIHRRTDDASPTRTTTEEVRILTEDDLGGVGGGSTIVGMTEAEYLALSPPNATTTYMLLDVGRIMYGTTAVANLSAAAAPASIGYMMSGAPTETSMRVAVSTTEPSTGLRLAYSTDPGMASPSYTDTLNVDNVAQVALFDITGLPSHTRIYYQAVSQSQPVGPINSAKTSGSLTDTVFFAFGACALDTDAPTWADMSARNPDFFLSMGDMPYMDYGGTDPSVPRGELKTMYGQTWTQNLLSTTPFVYAWDDHDFGPDNSDASNPAKEAIQQVYRELQPHYPLADANAIYHAYTHGPVRFITMDLRSERVTNSIMDDAQMVWLKDELTAAAADANIKLVVLQSSVPWISSASTDTWFGFTAERLEIGDHILDVGLENRLVMVSGDMHGVAYDDGTNNTFNTAGVASFPVFQSAPVNHPNSSVKGGPYSGGTFTASDNQYSTMQVVPSVGADPTELDVVITAYGDDVQLYSYSLTTDDGNFALAAPTDITLSSNEIPEASADGSIVGALSADQPGALFTIVSDPSGNFAIDGNNLVTATGATLVETATHNITLRATNGTGFFDEAFTITVTAPVLVGNFGTIVQTQETRYVNFTTSSSVTLPAAPTTGNLLVVSIAVDKATPNITLPTGFTLLESHPGTNGEISYLAAYKISDGTETGAITSSWVTTGRRAVMHIVEVEGPFSTPLLSTTVVETEAQATSVTLTPPAVVNVPSVALAFYTNDSANSVGVGGTPTATGGYTVEPIYAVTGSDSQPILIFAHKVITAGETPTVTIGHTGSNDGSVGYLVIFN